MFRKSFFQQLFITIFILLVITIILYFAVTIRVVRNGMYRETLDRQMAMADIAMNMIPAEGFADSDEVQSFCDILVSGTNVRMTVVDKDGVVLGDTAEDRATMDNHAYRPEIRTAFLEGQGYSTRFSNTVQLMMLYTAVYVPDLDMVLRLSQSCGQHSG